MSDPSPRLEGHVYSSLGVLSPLAKRHSAEALTSYNKTARRLALDYGTSVPHEDVVLYLRLSKILSRDPTTDELTKYRVRIESSRQRKGYFLKSCTWYKYLVQVSHMVSLQDH